MKSENDLDGVIDEYLLVGRCLSVQNTLPYGRYSLTPVNIQINGRF